MNAEHKATPWHLSPRIYPGVIIGLCGAVWLALVQIQGALNEHGASTLLTVILFSMLLIGWLITPWLYTHQPYGQGLWETTCFVALPLPLLCLCFALSNFAATTLTIMLTVTFFVMLLFGSGVTFINTHIQTISLRAPLVALLQWLPLVMMATQIEYISNWIR